MPRNNLLDDLEQEDKENTLIVEKFLNIVLLYVILKKDLPNYSFNKYNLLYFGKYKKLRLFQGFVDLCWKNISKKEIEYIQYLHDIADEIAKNESGQLYPQNNGNIINSTTILRIKNRIIECTSEERLNTLPSYKTSKRKIAADIFVNNGSSVLLMLTMSLLFGNPFTAAGTGIASATGIAFKLLSKGIRGVRAYRVKNNQLIAFNKKDYKIKENDPSYKDIWNSVRYWIQKKNISRIPEDALDLSKMIKSIEEDIFYKSFKSFPKHNIDIGSQNRNYDHIAEFTYKHFSARIKVEQLNKDLNTLKNFYNYFKNDIIVSFFANEEDFKNDGDEEALKDNSKETLKYNFSHDNITLCINKVKEFFNAGDNIEEKRKNHRNCGKLCYFNHQVQKSTKFKVHSKVTFKDDYGKFVNDVLFECYNGENKSSFKQYTSYKDEREKFDIAIDNLTIWSYYHKSSLDYYENFFTYGNLNLEEYFPFDVQRPRRNSINKGSVLDAHPRVLNVDINDLDPHYGQSDAATKAMWSAVKDWSKAIGPKVKAASYIDEMIVNITNFSTDKLFLTGASAGIYFAFYGMQILVLLTIDKKNLDIEKEKLIEEIRKMIENRADGDRIKCLRALRTFLKDGQYFEKTVDELCKLQEYHLKFSRKLRECLLPGKDFYVGNCEQAYSLYYQIFKFEKHLKILWPKLMILSFFMGINKIFIEKQAEIEAIIEPNISSYIKNNFDN